jgi:integrase
MSVHKEKNGKYRVALKYKNHSGKIVNTSKRGFRTKQEAVFWEAEFREQRKKDIDIPFDYFIEEKYLKDMKINVKATTYQTRHHAIRNYITSYFGSTNIASITAGDIRNWQNHMKNRGFAPSSLKTINKIISSIFTFAVRFYRLPENPARLAGSMGYDENGEKGIWTHADFKKFINQVEEKKFEALYYLLFFTGMRIGEALALTIKDINFETGVISITKSYQKIKKVEYITTPKTKSSVRKIDMPNNLANILKQYIEKKYDLKGKDRLFPYTQSIVGIYFRKELSHIDVPYIRIHDIRHSHASLLIELGENPVLIAERLGHKSVQMTLDRYSHLYPNRQKKLAQKLDNLDL